MLPGRVVASEVRRQSGRLPSRVERTSVPVLDTSRVDQTSPISAALPPADGIRQYRINLAREMRQYRRLMLESGLGEARLSVVVSTRQGVSRPIVAIHEGSGDVVRDEAVLAVVRLAVATASIPEHLHDKAFALTLPIQIESAD